MIVIEVPAASSRRAGRVHGTCTERGVSPPVSFSHCPSFRHISSTRIARELESRRGRGRDRDELGKLYIVDTT